jgi:hypothetical protein
MIMILVDQKESSSLTSAMGNLSVAGVVGFRVFH